MKTETRQIQVERWSIKSSRPFDEIVSALDAALGHPDIKTLLPRAEAGSPAEMKAVLENALGPSGFMEFIRFYPGKIVAKETKSSARIQRFVIGNPLIMKEMVKQVPDAASYAPVTILVVEEANFVRLSYDTMASLLGPYGSAEASEVARDLDKKVESLLIDIAR
jgi:uncharacterized protein (DUF302 family)